MNATITIEITAQELKDLLGVNAAALSDAEVAALRTVAHAAGAVMHFRADNQRTLCGIDFTSVLNITPFPSKVTCSECAAKIPTP